MAEQVEEVERLGRLRRFLSPQVAELILTSGNEALLQSHRREICVVFCDLRGFTAFSEVGEPEDVMNVLDGYHAAMGALIFEHGGTLKDIYGDGMMIFFNDPVPSEDPVGQAVRMAVDMQARVEELSREWRRRGYELALGIGIAQGYATMGQIGFEGRRDYGAVGSVVNLAARLCSEARGGQILLSARAFGHVDTVVSAEPVGPLQLKGFQQPITAYSVASLTCSIEQCVKASVTTPGLAHAVMHASSRRRSGAVVISIALTVLLAACGATNTSFSPSPSSERTSSAPTASPTVRCHAARPAGQR